jgi:hypothetical protein
MSEERPNAAAAITPMNITENGSKGGKNADAAESYALGLDSP